MKPTPLRKQRSQRTDKSRGLTPWAWALRACPGFQLIPIVCLGPVLEEVLCRGIILKSFKSYLPSTAAVLVAAVLVAALLFSLAHRQFWSVLPSQLMLSIVYVALGDSLPASIAAHIKNNAFALVLASGAFEKWHAYAWSWK